MHNKTLNPLKTCTENIMNSLHHAMHAIASSKDINIKFDMFITMDNKSIANHKIMFSLRIS